LKAESAFLLILLIDGNLPHLFLQLVINKTDSGISY
jgi:hypothetical protein